MKRTILISVIALVLVALVIAPSAWAVSAQPLAADATPQARLRVLDSVSSLSVDAVLAVPTPTPAPVLSGVARGSIREVLNTSLLSSVIINKPIEYIARVDPSRLSALGMQVLQDGSQQKLEVVDPDRLVLLKVIAREGLQVSTDVTPVVPCDSSINYNTRLAGEIADPGAVCGYTFQGNQDDHVSIIMDSQQFGPYFDLVGPDGTTVEPSNNDVGEDGHHLYRLYSLPQAGTYTIVAQSQDGQGSGSFELTLSSLKMMLLSAPLCAGKIELGNTISSAIPFKGAKCFYTFKATAGDSVTIAMNSQDTALDPLLDLENPDAAKESSDDDGGGNGNSLILDHQLLRNGIYTIVAHSYNDESQGRFDLALFKSVPPTPTPKPKPPLCGGSIGYGQTVNGQIPAAGDECRYQFSGRAGDVITIAMNHQDDALDPLVTLLDPSNTWTADDDDNGGDHNSLIAGYRLSRGGVYTIVAGSYDGGSSGRFTLTLRRR